MLSTPAEGGRLSDSYSGAFLFQRGGEGFWANGFGNSNVSPQPMRS